MRFHVVDRADEVAPAAATLLARRIDGRPEPTLGLPTGRTPVPFYDELARRNEAGQLDLSRTRGFNLDELLLPADHPSSFRRFMSRHAWGRTGLDATRCDIPDGETADPSGECRRYADAIEDAGGFDLAVLGLGEDGHVAFNLPGPPRNEVHRVELPESHAVRLGCEDPAAPLAAITVGFGVLRSANALLLMAWGTEKAEAIKALRDGPPDPAWPCSLLRDHPQLDVVIDAAASGSGAPSRGGGMSGGKR